MDLMLAKHPGGFWTAGDDRAAVQGLEEILLPPQTGGGFDEGLGAGAGEQHHHVDAALTDILDQSFDFGAAGEIDLLEHRRGIGDPAVALDQRTHLGEHPRFQVRNDLTVE